MLTTANTALRRGIVVLCALLLITATVALSGGAAATPSRQSTNRWSGQAAIDRLGTRLAAVADRHGMSVAKLKSHLVSDATLFVDSTDRLGYIEPAPEATLMAPTVYDGNIADADTFALSSRPGASRVIYLDFNGEPMANKAWNESLGGACNLEPFDSDGVPSSFSSSELAVIKSVWRRVSEEYAGFNVNVTTQDPGAAAIDRTSLDDQQFGTRAVVTKSSALCPNGKTVYGSLCPAGCGGLAYLGVFDEVGSNQSYYLPALIFQNGLGVNSKYIADAISHEVGHNLGLSHDGTTSGCGSTGLDPCGYYQGQGAWAPVMGVGYYNPIVQWSRGEYAGASNAEDDYTIMQANGLPAQPDDHGNTATVATTLTAPTLSAQGYISGRTDVDAFKVSVGAGTLSISVNPITESPNLDVRLEVRNSSGTLVASADPLSGANSYDQAYGMAAGVTATVPAGTYTILIDGTGAADPLTNGYSDYSSVGSYTLSGTAVVPGNLAPTASFTASTTSGVAPLSVSFNGSGSTDPEGGALTYSWAFGDGTTATGATATKTYNTAGTYTATLTVTDPAGASASTSRTITVTAPVASTKDIDVSAMTITGSKTSKGTTVSSNITVRNGSSTAIAKVAVTGVWKLGTTTLSTRTAATSTSGVALLSTGTIKTTTGQVVQLCITGLVLTGYTWNETLFVPTTKTDCRTWTSP